jgi:PTH2 family peptidyl-tRNA hydrolase
MIVNRDYKQVIILRQDINMSVGKKVAQACHAAVLAVDMARKISPDILERWSREGQKKVALKVQTEKELIDLYNQARALKLPCAIIQDAGLTELEPGTITAVGIGPARAVDIDRITGTLKLL